MVASLRSKWAAGKAVRAGLALGGRISKSIRNRRAPQPPAQLQRNPPGRGRLAVFPRCSLLTSRTIFALGERPKSAGLQKWCGMLVARALKNSQLTCGDITIICETVH